MLRVKDHPSHPSPHTQMKSIRIDADQRRSFTGNDRSVTTKMSFSSFWVDIMRPKNAKSYIFQTPTVMSKPATVGNFFLILK